MGLGGCTETKWSIPTIVYSRADATNILGIKFGGQAAAVLKGTRPWRGINKSKQTSSFRVTRDRRDRRMLGAQHSLKLNVERCRQDLHTIAPSSSPSTVIRNGGNAGEYHNNGRRKSTNRHCTVNCHSLSPVQRSAELHLQNPRRNSPQDPPTQSTSTHPKGYAQALEVGTRLPVLEGGAH